MRSYRNLLERAQKKIFLWVASIYCTISTAAVKVIAGVLPIDNLLTNYITGTINKRIREARETS